MTRTETLRKAASLIRAEAATPGPVSLHPDVALAVAESLETASRYDRWNDHHRTAFAIASAYLGDGDA